MVSMIGIILIGALLILSRSVLAPSNGGVYNFEECKKAGNKVQESYPEVCITNDGRRFVNPGQVVE